MPDDELSPLQRETLDVLSRRGDPVVFDPGFVTELRADADAGLAELAERVDAAPTDDPAGRPGRVWVSKFAVAQVLGCEAAWAEPDDFAWSAATARGTVCHRAVQLGLHWRGPLVPAALVDEAIELLVGEDASLGAWLRECGDAVRADVRSLAVERLSAFLEAFPPLQPAWRPVTEARTSYPPSGSIVLSAKPDLTIGHAAAGESRKVLVDLKTGRLRSSHRDDLRYYALVETLVRRIPPRLTVTYSLESSAPDVEVVTETLLRSSLRRTLDAVERMVEIRFEGRDPGACGQRWCRHCGPGAGAGDGLDDDLD